MIHILALAGFVLIILLPVTLGAIVFAPLRAWEKVWAVVGMPFTLGFAVILIAIGWGDWPDLPAEFLPD